MLFEEPKGDHSDSELAFRYASFWFTFHNVPQVCLCRKYAEAMGNTIGEFEQFFSDGRGRSTSESLRVRVKIDVNEPIKRGTNIKIKSKADKTWIPVTYEKLSDFCYHCGKLGHMM